MTEAAMLRDLNKARIAFDGAREVATGHWGCGAFGNNHDLMFLKQWLAASDAGAATMHYHDFSRSQSHNVVPLSRKLGHLTVCQRIVQWRGTVWHDVAVHFALTTVVTLLVHQIFYAERLLGLPPFIGGPALEEPRAQVSDLAWRVFMFPLSFLLALRSNQAFKRYLEGISYYTDLNCSITELCRQTTYIRTAEGSFDLPEPGTQPREGQASCDDEAKQRIIRHCVAFATATRRQKFHVRILSPRGGTARRHRECQRVRLRQPGWEPEEASQRIPSVRQRQGRQRRPRAWRLGQQRRNKTLRMFR